MRKKSTLFVAITIAFFLACTHRANFMDEKGSTDCSDPPTGVIRFALLSGDNTAVRYEWSGTTYRKVGFEPTGKVLIRQFHDGSFYKWDYWGDEVQKISRNAVGSGTILTAPYAMNRDGSILAAAVVSSEDRSSPATRIALLQVKDSDAAVKIIDLGEYISSVAWSPQGNAVVILSITEKYVKRTLRERIGWAIGHPIPYSDITLTTIDVDGKKCCSIRPARELAYGSGYVRWDDQ